MGHFWRALLHPLRSLLAVAQDVYGVAGDGVVTTAAVDHVHLAVLHHDRVGARAAVYAVFAIAADQQVVAAAAEDRVGAVAAFYLVAAVVAVDYVVAAVGGDEIA